MAYTEFYVQTTGSNLNAGSTNADAAAFTYASGNWVASTGVFTVASGNPSSDGVAVGDFASVYPDGSTVGVFVGRVTARTTTTITVSLTAKAGTAPTDGTGNRTLKIGGAWKGPNAAESFPFGFVASTLVDASSNPTCVNLKGGSNYAITAAMTHANQGVMFQGYTSTVRDGGKATIDGTIAGTAYVLLTLSGNDNRLQDLIFANNGTTGTAAGLTSSAGENDICRCVVHDVRANGFNISGTGDTVTECEAYACNQANTSLGSGFSTNSLSNKFIRCTSHDNVGSNAIGFVGTSTNGHQFEYCVADSNGLYGFHIVVSRGTERFIHCDAYNNVGDGIRVTDNSTSGAIFIENCNLVHNGTGGTGYGINLVGFTAGEIMVRIRNCGFGSGTQANATGTTNGLLGFTEEGSITFTANTTPWVDPANGDFRINSSEAKGAGRGGWTQTAASYAGTVSYPDIGAAQHRDDPQPILFRRQLVR